jgi:uncharacterized membrane protein
MAFWRSFEVQRQKWLSLILYLLFGALCASFLLALLPSSAPLAIFLLLTGMQAILTALHAESILGSHRFLLLLGLTLPITFLAEALGVHSGLIFGRYYYAGILGPQIAGIPVAIPIAWFTMLYPSWLLARLLVGRARTSLRYTVLRAILAGSLMVAWDLVLDPALATGFGCWAWEASGSYMGIPATNFLSWWAVSTIEVLLFERLSGPRPGQLFTSLQCPEGLPFLFYLANLLSAALLCFQVGLGTAGWVGFALAALVFTTILSRWRVSGRACAGRCRITTGKRE